MIGFNVQPLASENLTGIGNYAADVLKCLLPKVKDYDLHVFNFMGRNNTSDFIDKHLGGSYDKEHLKMTKLLPLSLYIRLGRLGRIIPYSRLTDSKPDVTVFFNYLAPGGVKGKNIITIYDMVCKRFPETMDDRNRKLLQRFLQKSSDRADAVVTISEFSKREIMDTLKVPEEKIFVAPCGLDSNFYKPASDIDEKNNEKAALLEKWGLSKYILYVGTLEPRKNTITLIKAFNELALDDREVKLVLAGGVGWHSEETLKAIDESPFKSRIVRTGYISNEEKRALYRNAAVFVFPSMYEGFGMPVTEAMACGTPCVVSNASSLPEISNGLAPLVDPFDAVGFKEEILKMLNKEVDEEYSLKLIENARRYTWENAASVYEKAILFAKDA